MRRLFMLALAVWLATASAVLAGDTTAALEQGLRTILSRESLRGARVGVEIRSLTEDRTLYRKRSDESFIPASNQKLLSVALALTVLGSDHTFDTPLIAAGPVDENGTLHGDLWVVGSGDPTLQKRFFESDDPTAALRPFVEAVTMQGVHRIQGDLVLDDRVFDHVSIAPGWPDDQLDQEYCAPVGGLSLNGNCFEVLVTGRPDRDPMVQLRPEALGYTMRSKLTRSSKASEMTVWLARPDEKGQVLVRGRVGGSTGTAELSLPIRHPTRFFGRALGAALQRANVRLDGAIRGTAADEARPGEGARSLYTRRSPLLPAIYVCGKESDNGIAEHLWKASAVAANKSGSFEGGAAVCGAFLEGLGCDLEGSVRVDGSGLSRMNRVTPSQMVQMLAAMYDSPFRDPFLRSLAISGVDGTLKKRMTEPSMRYRVRAKTGYLRAVSCLSGYVMAGDPDRPHVYAFSILVNDFRGGLRDIQTVQDDVCRLLASQSS